MYWKCRRQEFIIFMTATTGKKSPLYFWFIFMIHWPAGMRSTINEAWDFMQFGHPAGDTLHLMLILFSLSSHSQESRCVKDTLKKRYVYIIQSSLDITDNYHTVSWSDSFQQSIALWNRVQSHTLWKEKWKIKGVL